MESMLRLCQPTNSMARLVEASQKPTLWDSPSWMEAQHIC